jgi:two-component system, NtrC family, response regulator AtoC
VFAVSSERNSPTGLSALELVVYAGETIRTFALPAAGEVTIGRGDESALRIDDPSVSRQHAVLRLGETLEIEDLGGANGTFVRQKPRPGADDDTLTVRQLLGRKAQLAVGDRLLFGTASVVVRRRPAIELPDLPSGDRACGTEAIAAQPDPAMRALYAQAARAARTDINVLLLGETGVGKEVLARAIHAHSPRSKGPFMGINCAALADSLLESELFGSEKGAFTGAAAARPGLFEASNGGTVFLDEIGELPLPTQAKLLRVLEERVVMRVGSTRTRPIDVRFVAASNVDVEAASQQGGFRRDLFFRLNGITFVIPPLRDRSQEIEALAASFLTAASRGIERARPPAISAPTLDLLNRYAWPGNVRELRNVIERAILLCLEDTIRPEHLPPSLLAAVRTGGTQPSQSYPSQGETGALQTQMKSIERAKILEALDRCRGNQSEASQLLGMPRRTLVSRLTEYGLTRARKREGET